MRMAKASKEDFNSVHAFMNACELCLEKEKFSFQAPEDNWEDLDDEDEDKQLILRIKKELEEDEGEVDNRILMYEFLVRKFRQASCDWRRVYWAADILIDNVCDPTESHLAFYPGYDLQHVAAEM